YKYIQVDEGQDTSLIQFKIIEKIAAPLNNLMIVADDDQSIYSFRASDVSYLLNLKSIYPDLKIIEMTENHRSSKNIVNISKAFIDTNQNRYPKDLFTNNDFSGKITIRSLRNVRDEYKYIIENIKKGEKNAILFRNNIQALNIISFLMEDGLDFSVNITSLNFFESKIIDDLFNIIEFSDDFDRLDLFCEIYYKMGTFLNKKEVDKLSYKGLNNNVFEGLYEMDLEDYKIETLIQKEKQLKHIRQLSLDKKISYIYKYMDYKSYITNFSKKYREEVVNKDLFVESMVNFTKNLDTKEDFYNKKEKLEKKLSTSTSDLILSSIHKSKGLEYDNVFVINMVKSEFPIIVDNEDIGKKIEEERRVMYVAMTRAKKNLHLLTIKKRGTEKLSPSIFYNQIKDLI
ncbi:MAG: ATP-dependent helicase, partial [Anaerococcus prevotii]|nr:ATP-dependent helicase [Anaerococcus prevotii]